MAGLPSRVQNVVIGGGVAGTSVAYHLARAGMADTLLLERDVLTSGTTWHAAGLMGRMSGSPRITRMRRYGAELYAELERTTGLPSGYVKNGGLTIATDPVRMGIIEEWASKGRANGTRCWLIGPEEAAERAPLVNMGDVLGAIWSPDDGQINPVDSTMILAKAARMEGATVVEHTPVAAILTEDGAVTGVETAAGAVIECENVVLAGGMWSRDMAQSVGVSVPLWPCEHEYMLTAPMEGIRGMPVIRSYDESLYLKEDAGRMLIGLFEPNAHPAFADRAEVPLTPTLRDREVPKDFSSGT